MAISNHVLALKATGACWGWGLNSIGQLGVQDEDNRSSPVAVVGNHTFIKIAGGHNVSAGLKSDGSVWTWGEAQNGCLGDNTVTRKSSPVLVVGSHSFTDISVGEIFMMGLKVNGEVWSWGYNNLYGLLGDNTKTSRSSPVLVVGGHAFVKISSGEGHTLALKANGECWSWGWNDDGQIGNFLSDPGYTSAADKSSPVSVVGNHSFITVSAGNYHSLALKADGTAWSWGKNTGGALGTNTQWFYQLGVPTSLNMGDLWQDQSDEKWYRAACIGADQIAVGEWEEITGATNNSSSPIMVVGGHSFVAISAGGSFSLALKSNGECWSWGNNGGGQLGDNTLDNKTSPVKVVGDHLFIQITAGYYHSVGLKDNGEVWCWGYGFWGALGNLSGDNVSSPVLVVGSHTFTDLQDFHGEEVSISSSSSSRSSSSSSRSSSSRSSSSSSCRSSSSSSRSSSSSSSSSSQSATAYYSDDFSGYTSDYVKIDSCNTTTDWGIWKDTTGFTQNTSRFKEGTACLQINITPTANNRSNANKTISQIDLSGMSKLAFWVYIADSTYSSSFRIRIGADSSNYYEYSHTEINDYWNYFEATLSSPTSTVGSPNLNNIQYLALDYYYATGEANSSWLVDDIWAYKDTTFTGGVWIQPSSSYLYGALGVHQNSGTYELLTGHTSRSGAGNHGRALYGSTTGRAFASSVDCRIFNINSGWGGRLLFDYLDGINFSCVYISAQYNKAGIEQYINNVRNYSEVNFTPSVGTTYSLEVEVSGNDVVFNIDGEQKVSYTLTETRTTGGYGLESFGGGTLSNDVAIGWSKFIVRELSNSNVNRYGKVDYASILKIESVSIVNVKKINGV